MAAGDFWRENSVYPFVHSVVPAALYFATRRVALALLLMYVWETVEATLALVASRATFGEHAADSLIGDPLVGALGIGALALLDAAYGWAAAVCDATPLATRLLAFAYIAGLSLAFFPLGAERVVRLRPRLVAAYGVAIVLIGALMYAPALRAPHVAAAVAAWLALVAALTLAGAVSRPSSVYVRVAAVNGVAFLAALILFAIEQL